MLLYDNPESGNCYKVRLVLAHRGLAYERRTVGIVDKTGREDALDGVHPTLRIPALVLDDGRALAESNAIAWYLAQGSDLVPGDAFAHAQMLQWMFFEQYEHEPSLAVLRYARVTAADPQAFAVRLPSLTAKAQGVLGVMQRQLESRPYIGGDAMSVADLVLYPNTHFADEAGVWLGDYPAVAAWVERVASHPRHVPMTAP